MRKIALIFFMPSLLMTFALMSMLQSCKEEDLIEISIDEAKQHLKDNDIFKKPYVIPEYAGVQQQETSEKLWRLLEVTRNNHQAELTGSLSSSIASNTFQETLSTVHRTPVAQTPGRNQK